MGFQERLSELRRRAGLSRQQVGELAGLWREHVRLLEIGRRRSPEVDTLKKIARLFGADFEWLATGDGRPPSDRALRAAIKEAHERFGTVKVSQRELSSKMFPEGESRLAGEADRETDDREIDAREIDGENARRRAAAG